MSQSKICVKCKDLKDIEQFNCNKGTKDGREFQCKKCRSSYYLLNREIVLKRSKEWVANNRSRYLDNQKKYSIKNSEVARKRSNVYYDNNKEKVFAYANEYNKKRKIRDVNFHISVKIKSRMYRFMDRKGKTAKFEDIIGCSYNEFIEHLSSKFSLGMSWGNYGKKRGTWNIDHISPYKNFDLTKIEEIVIWANYKNLQPLWYIDNIKKSNK